MKAIIPLFLISLMIFTACGEQKKSAKDQLYDKVMAVHDEIMPKMGDMSKYKKQLNEKIERLVAEGEEANADKVNELKDAVKGLENSHEEMMNWMREFDKDFEGMVEKEIMDYLINQFKKIETVGKATNSAIDNATILIEEMKNNQKVFIYDKMEGVVLKGLQIVKKEPSDLNGRIIFNKSEIKIYANNQFERFYILNSERMEDGILFDTKNNKDDKCKISVVRRNDQDLVIAHLIDLEVMSIFYISKGFDVQFN